MPTRNKSRKNNTSAADRRKQEILKRLLEAGIEITPRNTSSDHFSAVTSQEKRVVVIK